MLSILFLEKTFNIWYIPKANNKRYITPHIEKVIPAGTNKLGIWSDNSPVYFPLNGIIFASELTIIVRITDIKLHIANNFNFNIE